MKNIIIKDNNAYVGCYCMEVYIEDRTTMKLLVPVSDILELVICDSFSLRKR